TDDREGRGSDRRSSAASRTVVCNAGARIAMMAMTTRSSIKVKADGREICGCLPLTRFVRLRRVMLYTACCHFSECLKAMSWPSLFQPPHVWISELVWLLVLAIVGPD